VAGVIDAVVPGRADAAASVGTYLALATANRIVDPCSKLGFGDWWAMSWKGMSALPHSIRDLYYEWRDRRRRPSDGSRTRPLVTRAGGHRAVVV
jgi:hypothetical protein